MVLVKSFLRMMSDFPLNTSAAVVAACKAIVINTSSDAALIAAIKAFQEDVEKFKNDPGVVVDGRVSPAKESFRYQVGIPWTIVHAQRANEIRGPVRLRLARDPSLNQLQRDVIADRQENDLWD